MQMIWSHREGATQMEWVMAILGAVLLLLKIANEYRKFRNSGK